MVGDVSFTLLSFSKITVLPFYYMNKITTINSM